MGLAFGEDEFVAETEKARLKPGISGTCACLEIIFLVPVSKFVISNQAQESRKPVRLR